MPASDAALYMITITRTKVGVVTLTIGKILAVFDPNLKWLMDIEYGANSKLGREQYAGYKRNTNATYGVAHGNICRVIIGRCELDIDVIYDTVHVVKDLISLLIILQTVCVQSNLGILCDPIFDGVNTFKKRICIGNQKYCHTTNLRNRSAASMTLLFTNVEDVQ